MHANLPKYTLMYQNILLSTNVLSIFSNDLLCTLTLLFMFFYSQSGDLGTKFTFVLVVQKVFVSLKIPHAPGATKWPRYGSSIIQNFQYFQNLQNLKKLGPVMVQSCLHVRILKKTFAMLCMSLSSPLLNNSNCIQTNILRYIKDIGKRQNSQ